MRSRSYAGRGQSYKGDKNNDRFSDDRRQEDRDVLPDRAIKCSGK